jgi:hypothetical protein
MTHPSLPPEALAVAVQAGSAIAGQSGAVVSDTLSGLTERALQSVRLKIYEWRQTEAQLKREIDERLARRGVTAPVEPEPAVAIPAIQAALFTSDELRGYFAELLATAMDPATAERAHPAYADILRQLLPAEARLLSLVGRRKGRALIESRTTWTGLKEAPTTVATTQTLAGEAGLPLTAPLPLYFNNLTRLGLVEQRTVTWGGTTIRTVEDAVRRFDNANWPVTHYGSPRTLVTDAAWLVEYTASPWAGHGTEQLPRALRARTDASAEEAYPGATAARLEIDILEATPLGKQFIAACMAP